MNKKIITFIACFLAFSILTPYSYAAKSVSQLEKEMKERENERKKVEKEINSKKDERDEKIKERNSLDLQISDLMHDIDDTQALINEKQEEIDKKQEDIDGLTETIDENTDKLKTRLKIMYQYGNTSYLKMILEAKGLSDFFTRVRIANTILKHDKELINQFVDARTEIEDAKKIIETEQNEQIEAKNILNSKKSSLVKLQNQQESLINELNSDIKSLEERERKAEEDYNALKQELNKALGKTTSEYTGSGKFVWPSAASRRVTSEFGYREKPNAAATSNHRGIDIGAPSGTDVLAAEAGTVVTAGYNRSYGYYVTINHGGGYVTLYAHNSRLLVSSGDKVKRGQVIAKVGSTGNSTGPHIHFEVMVNGVCKNPRNFF